MKKRTVAALCAVLIAGPPAAAYLWVDGQVKREVDLSSIEKRPPKRGGMNFLLVGSDARQGVEGARTDTVMVVHVGKARTTLVSLPRDSWVTIPEFVGESSRQAYPASRNKLNAAFAFGGSKLLTRTVEESTGLHIDHYAEIGFRGFEQLVSAVGGVEVDIKKRIKDKNSGADFQPGKQKLDGKQALAFVRQRYQEAEGDLGRTKNQQQLLHALANQVTPTPDVIRAGLKMVKVDKGMGLMDMKELMNAMKKAKTMNVPVANPGYATSKGSAVLWDGPKATALFEGLKND